MIASSVLLTGATGFTGRYLQQALEARGQRVHSLGCDLTDAVAVQAAVAEIAPEWVYHLAALSFVPHADPEAFYRVNTIGTTHLLDALGRLAIPPKGVLIASSANVYGNPKQTVIDESVVPAPISHYACSKLAMEHMVSTYYDRLPILLTRPFNYTGPGQDARFLIPKIVAHFAQEARDIELGNLDVSRDFSDVRDVVAIYLALMDSELRHTVVNVCRGEAISLRAIIAGMEEIAGYSIKVSVNPALVRNNEIAVLRGDRQPLDNLLSSSSCIPFDQTLLDMYRFAQSKLCA